MRNTIHFDLHSGTERHIRVYVVAIGITCTLLTSHQVSKFQLWFGSNEHFATTLKILEQLQCPALAQQSQKGVNRAPQTYYAEGAPFSSGSRSEPNESQSAFTRPPRLDRSPGVSDPFFGSKNAYPARSTLARTHTMPSGFQHQDTLFQQAITARVPRDDFYTRSKQESQSSRPSTGPPSTLQYSTPFAHPSILSRPQREETRPATASGVLVTTGSTPTETAFRTPMPRQATTQHRLPEGMTAVADDTITQPHPFFVPQKQNILVPANLPVNLTPYLPPIRPLPFPKRGSFSTTATKSMLDPAGRSKAHSSPILRPIRPASALRESAISASSPTRPETGRHANAERPQTPLTDTVNTREQDGSSRDITTPAGINSAGRHNDTSATSKYQTPLSTVKSTDAFDGYPTSSTISSPIRPQLSKTTRIDSLPNAPAHKDLGATDTSTKVLDHTPRDLAAATPQETLPISDTSGATSEISQSTANKRKANVLPTDGSSPPKKKAAPRKRAPKATAPPPVIDPGVELMKLFKDYDVSSVMQDFTNQRPGSGRQNFVNDLICRHLEDDAFVDFCENVENAWCRIGLEHPGSEMEKRRATRGQQPGM